MSQKSEAAALGMALNTYRHRVKHGIPLDAPILSPVERMEHANKIRLQNAEQHKLMRERAKRMKWQERDRQKQAEKAARKRAAERRAEMRKQQAAEARAAADAKREAAAEARWMRENAWQTINAAPRHEWQNPFALLAGRRSVTTASPTGGTTSARSSSTGGNGTNGGVSMSGRTYARGGI